MKPALILSILMLSLLTSKAEGDVELQAILKLFGEVKIGDDYETIKKLLPAISAIKADAGVGNTEANAELKIGSVKLKGEFNFAHGRLVSHGFTSGEISHGEAHALLLKCLTILEQIHGKSERWVQLPNESDGPRDSLGVQFNWKKGRTLLAVDLGYRSKTATVSWGAQDDH